MVDFEAVLAAMPEDYDGDYMLEVDEPSAESRYESYQICDQLGPIVDHGLNTHRGWAVGRQVVHRSASLGSHARCEDG